MYKKEQWICNVCKLKPSFENDKIDPEMSPCRVIRLVRLLNNLASKDIYGHDTMYRKAISQSYQSKLETFHAVPDFGMVLHLCILLKITPEKFCSYTTATMNMTWKEAAMYIGNDIINEGLENS